MTCKESILALIEDLLRVFENSNKHIYKQLLYTRHRVRSKYTDSYVFSACRNFYIENKTDIENNEMAIFRSTIFGTVIDLVWSELSHVNRELVWEWIKKIVNSVVNYTDHDTDHDIPTVTSVHAV